jgi:prepilin-type processing-associated H-X9-DG protein
MIRGSTNLLICPMDQNKRTGGLNSYYYSYSANGYQFAPGSTEVFSTFNGPNEPNWVSGKLSSVHSPANKLALVEEPTSVSEIPSACLAVDPTTADFISDDGRWVPGSGVGHGNTITTRHSGRGCANFADGHAQMVDYIFAADTNNFDLRL